MSLSVIIPTYQHVGILMRALSSLQGQKLSDFEIVVVDNAGDPQVEQAVSQFNLGARVPALYVAEPQLGLHHARHAGVLRASGDLLVFTDDDATFSPGWLLSYADAFGAYPAMAAAGGPVRPIWEASPPGWLLDLMKGQRIFGLLSLMEPYDDFRLEPGGFFFGVNMAIRRDALWQAGGFHPEAFGEVWLGDGETGLNRKLWEMGFLVGYVPGALVYHHIPSTRMSVAYACRRMANEGACTEYAAFHSRAHGTAWMGLRMAGVLLSLVRVGGTAAVRWAFRRDSLSLIRARMQGAYHLSRLRYLCRLMRDPQFRAFVRRKDWLTSQRVANEVANV